MKKALMTTMAVMVAVAAFGAAKSRPAKPMAGGDEEAVATGKDAKITIDTYPRPGRSCRLLAPKLEGASMIGQCYKKPREWIVLETKYTTFAKWQDQLTFTWHVLLDTKTATEKDKADREALAPYSYFTTSVTYVNVPKGSHAASVCLHPSYLERFGEPKAIALVITNKNGDELGGDTISEIKGIGNGARFWEDDNIMNKTAEDGRPMIERRQGLLDRSKTIWALVNPNDYELVLQ